MKKVSAVIVAAGEGSRIGGAVPKPYLTLCGRAMILRTLDRFFAARSIEQVILVVAAGELSRCEALLKSDPALGEKPRVLQSGGATRQQSVRAGLENVSGDCEIVVIHDGARPFVSPELINRCVESAELHGAVAVGLPARDTVKFIDDDRRVRSTPERRTVWTIQTPQAFQRNIIVEAHERAAAEAWEATDDAMLVERFGKPVWIVEGETTNLKITLPEDLWLAEAMIRDGRVG